MTTLSYLNDATVQTFSATVVRVEVLDGRTALVLDQTHFYPQGGGQPADHGSIAGAGGTFNVTDVRFVDGDVLHFGTFAAGPLEAGATVTGTIDSDRRDLHARLHSAGHVIDFAVRALGLSWIPTKGYHFPEGPYVEYTGAFEAAEREALLTRLTEACAALITADLPVTVRLLPAAELSTLCDFVPDNLPTEKPTRVVLFGERGLPCGGTHVTHLGAVGPITIRKVKAERGGAVRIGYDVSRDME
jgi:Ser-tRNA(Ala) deacylase AlaX